MATFPVKYINNNMRGAPQLSGTAGTLIAVLDAFLITGFGQVTALSVTVAGGIATASLQSGQSFDPYCVVWVDGATPAELNGEARVLTSSSSSITFATTAPDGVATGAITIKVAPVGQWEKPFTGTSKAVYRSTDVTGSRFCLWVDDSGTTTARVRGFESMTDVNTGTGPFPTDAQSNGGGYLFKSLVANANSVRYDLIADSKIVLWAIGAGLASNANYMNSPVRGFGDLLPLRPSGDGYAVGLSCQFSADTANYYGSGSFGNMNSVSNAGTCMARPIFGLGGAQIAELSSYSGQFNAISGNDGSLGPFPSSVDGELKYSKCFVTDVGSNTPRADVPGVLTIPQSGVSSFIGPRDVMDGTGAMSGRKLLAFLTAASVATTRSSCGVCLVDITGPWR